MTTFMRPLGGTGLNVSALGLGTVKLGRNQGVKYPSRFRIPDDEAVRSLLARARDLGINLIDTAPAYGSSEERLGQLLADRHRWVIVSKVGEEFEQGRSHFDFSAAHVRRSVERSLRRLRTDVIDVMLVHSDGGDLDIVRNGETLETLAALKREGKLRAYGLSGKTVEGGLEGLARSDLAMVTYNLDYDAELPVIAAAAAAGKGILIKKAFASGHLCGAGQDPVRRTMERILDTPGVSSIIVGTLSPVHLEENVSRAREVLGN